MKKWKKVTLWIVGIVGAIILIGYLAIVGALNSLISIGCQMVGK